MSRSVFLKRRFCGKPCMAVAFAARPVAPVVQYSTGHRRARIITPPGACTQCGAEGKTDVHHMDGDWLNNDPANLVRLCRRCHIGEHK